MHLLRRRAGTEGGGCPTFEEQWRQGPGERDPAATFEKETSSDDRPANGTRATARVISDMADCYWNPCPSTNKIIVTVCVFPVIIVGKYHE